MMMLDESKLEYNSMPSLDKRGKTFIYEGRFLRGIYKEYASSIREMFDCGLVDELNDLQYIPRTRISEYYSEEFPLILEHEMIHPQTYIFEWSSHMLCDAAELVIYLYKVLNKYGYGLWDCHTYNILFVRNTPVYCDFGSFYKVEELKTNKRGFPIMQFRSEYLLIAKMLCKNGYLIRSILKNTSLYDSDDIQVYYSGLGKKTKASLRFMHLLERVYDYFGIPNSRIESLFVSSLFSEVERIKNQQIARGRWSDYQHISMGIIEEVERDKNNEFSRYISILDNINNLGVSSIYEWGGNKGCLASLVCKKIDRIERYISCDYDDKSVDELYCFIRNEQNNNPFLNRITPLVSDFWDSITLKEMNGSLRMKSELVIGLAISHHLLLGQGINIDTMINSFAAYTTRYIIIEFMPLGLWDGGDNLPAIPNWYNLDWFLDHMKKVFTIIKVEQLERNRIMIVGQKR